MELVSTTISVSFHGAVSIGVAPGEEPGGASFGFTVVLSRLFRG